MTSLDKIRELLQKKPKNQSSDNNHIWYKIPEDGSVKIAFMPPVHGADVPGFIQYTHWNIPEVKRLTCLKTFGKTCPICEMIKEIEAKVPEDIISGYKPTERAIHNVLVLDDPKVDPNTPVLLTSGVYNYWWLLEQIVNPEIGDITNPEDNHTITFKRITRNGKLDRSISLRGRPIANSSEEIENILNKCADFNKIWTYSSDLENRLVTASQIIKEDLLNKMSVINTNEPTPSKIKMENQPTTLSNNQVDNSPKSNNSKIRIPDNAPECFGKHLDENDPGYSKCEICFHEVECMSCSK